jgi:hypothetical protein
MMLQIGNLRGAENREEGIVKKQRNQQKAESGLKKQSGISGPLINASEHSIY